MNDIQSTISCFVRKYPFWHDIQIDYTLPELAMYQNRTIHVGKSSLAEAARVALAYISRGGIILQRLTLNSDIYLSEFRVRIAGGAP